jgi:hypothetical protein
MRVATVHTNPVKPNKKVTIGIFESVEKNTSTSTKTVERFFVQYPKKKLDKHCEKYVRKLTKLVDECEKRFYNTE